MHARHIITGPIGGKRLQQPQPQPQPQQQQQLHVQQHRSSVARTSAINGAHTDTHTESRCCVSVRNIIRAVCIARCRVWPSVHTQPHTNMVFGISTRIAGAVVAHAEVMVNVSSSRRRWRCPFAQTHTHTHSSAIPKCHRRRWRRRRMRLHRAGLRPPATPNRPHRQMRELMVRNFMCQRTFNCDLWAGLPAARATRFCVAEQRARLISHSDEFGREQQERRTNARIQDTTKKQNIIQISKCICARVCWAYGVYV